MEVRKKKKKSIKVYSVNRGGVMRPLIYNFLNFFFLLVNQFKGLEETPLSTNPDRAIN